MFESFPPGFQRALESGSLDKVNEVLGKMSVEEAEEVVGQMGEAGMMSMETGVSDGTTKEGQEKLKELEKQAASEKVDGMDEDLAEQADGLEVADPD